MNKQKFMAIFVATMRSTCFIRNIIKLKTDNGMYWYVCLGVVMVLHCDSNWRVSSYIVLTSKRAHATTPTNYS